MSIVTYYPYSFTLNSIYNINQSEQSIKRRLLFEYKQTQVPTQQNDQKLGYYNISFQVLTDNYRMIQDQLACIVKRFKENDYYHTGSNKQNEYRRQSSNKQHPSSKQDMQCLNKKIRHLENIIDRMVLDGNKMHRYYEEMLLQSAQQFETFKDEYNGYRCSATEEKKEGESLVQYLNGKIEALNRQIANKQQSFRELLQKYELLEEQANETHLKESQHVKDIQTQLAKQSMHHEQERILTSKEIEEMKAQLEQIMNANEQLLNQNNYLKNVNESLAHNIQYLKNKLYLQDDVIHQQEQHVENRISLIELEQCDVDSISREEGFTLEEIKMNDSQEINLNGEKEILNLSQHYSKFNRTHQFMSKEKSNYEFVMMESNQRKSLAKRKEIVSQYKNLLVKIESVSSKEDANLKSRHITEIKEFKMHQPTPPQSIIDPYKAFFVLLTQCEKMNSRHFEKISHIDFTYLYPQLVKNYVPYNKWQENIQLQIEKKIAKK